MALSLLPLRGKLLRLFIGLELYIASKVKRHGAFSTISNADYVSNLTNVSLRVRE